MFQDLPEKGSPLYYHALKAISQHLLNHFEKELKVIKHNEKIRRVETQEIYNLQYLFQQVQAQIKQLIFTS